MTVEEIAEALQRVKSSRVPGNSGQVSGTGFD
jgi:hypothetical protein